MDIFNLRIGNGIDFHKFSLEEGTFSIKLGGISIAYKKYLLAHSDGDVILHSLCDSIFGALSEGNIGVHFPPSEPHWKDADSQIFLQYALSMLQKKGAKIINMDITVICEAPKIMPHSSAIIANISRLSQLAGDRIGLKAVTTEKMGFLGRGEGIGCYSNILISL